MESSGVLAISVIQEVKPLSGKRVSKRLGAKMGARKRHLVSHLG